MSSRPLLFLCGPTASGKTELALQLAQWLPGEIFSADSMQVYQGMRVGTAQPSAEERALAPYHLVDYVSPTEPYHAARYTQDATAVLQSLPDTHTPIICGGTGLYMDALLYGLDARVGAQSTETRQQYHECSPAQLHAMLQALDAHAAARIHPNNTKRVIRALEILQSGQSLPNVTIRIPKYAYVRLALTMPREDLYQRINTRVVRMLQNGLLEEARCLYEQRQQLATSAMAIGYKELFCYFDGNCTQQEAVENIQRETRRYAKRQLTWLRRYSDVHWLDGSIHRTAAQRFAAAKEILQKEYFPLVHK